MSSNPTDTSNFRLSKSVDEVVCTSEFTASKLTTACAMIFPYNDSTEFVDTMKFLLQVSAPSSGALNPGTDASGSITMYVYNVTDAKDVTTITLDVSDILRKFEAGTSTVEYRTITLYGLNTKISKSYDTVWQFKLAVTSSSSISVSIQAIQRFYYKL